MFYIPNIYKNNLKTKTYEILEIYKIIFPQALKNLLVLTFQVLPFFYPHFFLYAI